MKGVVYHVKKADHSQYHTVQDYIDAFNEGSDVLYKSMYFQNLSKEKKSIIETAWNTYNTQKREQLREIEAAQRREQREASKPYPSITEVLERITENPELIPHFIGLLELDSTCIEYRDNIRKAVWYYKNNHK